jgi:hypothetical protein
METNQVELTIKGKAIKGRSITINEKTLVVTGRWIKKVAVNEEEWFADQAVDNPEFFITGLKKSKLKADIFTFSQKLPHTTQKYEYCLELDNYAVVPISSFNDWWTKRIPQVTRKNVRRAARMGVIVRVVDFDDEFVKGIINIYNESPIRQGRRFWHYGKEFDTVKAENSTYMRNSDFIGAYYNEELIGFIKLVYAGKEARIMQIISMIRHQDKRPTNALLAKAVEICEAKGVEYFIYGQYVYGKNTKSPLIEFKQRNGFEMVNIPRYYIPLTIKGKIILKLKLHHGLSGLIPGQIYDILLDIRSKWYEKRKSLRDIRKN